MTQLKQVYKCSVCGNMVEVVHASGGELVCCGKPMVLMVENSTDASMEKHVPMIERTGSGVRIVVGSVQHPMEEGHHIEWIELIEDGKVYRKHLQPGDLPEVEFEIDGDQIEARAYCNLHGLWKNNI